MPTKKRKTVLEALDAGEAVAPLKLPKQFRGKKTVLETLDEGGAAAPLKPYKPEEKVMAPLKPYTPGKKVSKAMRNPYAK